MRDSAAASLNRLGAMVALAASLVSISCGGGMVPAGHTTGGNQASATLTLNSSSVDFGSVAVGGSKTSSITLTNSSPSGAPDVTFSQVTTAGSGFTAKTANLPIVLAPGQSSNITLVFTPKAAGAATGSLSIIEDGAPDPSTVPLQGMGVGAGELGVSPSTLNFGTLTVGSSTSKTGTLTAGSASVRVTSAAWSGLGYSVSGISFPVTISAGQSVSFTVTFAPPAAGASAGSISFNSNASDSPTGASFSGIGAQAQSQAPSTQHSVELAWDPSVSQVTGYNVYRASGGAYSRLNSAPQTATSYVDQSVQAGATYSYATTAVDSIGVESAFSNPVTATIPAQ